MAELNRARAEAIQAAYGVVAAEGPDPAALAAFMADATQLGLGDSGFDWMHWSAYLCRRTEDPAFIADASVETLCRIATTHLRLDRFVGGHLERMCEAGVLDAIVERLQTLADQDLL